MGFKIGVKLAVDKSQKELWECVDALNRASLGLTSIEDNFKRLGKDSVATLVAANKVEVNNTILTIKEYREYFKRLEVDIDSEDEEKKVLIESLGSLREVIDNMSKENVRLNQQVEEKNREIDKLRESAKVIDIQNNSLIGKNKELEDYKNSRVEDLLNKFEEGMKSIQLRKKFIEEAKDNRESGATNEMIAALYKECDTNVEIAERLGGLLTPAGVGQRLRKMGLCERRNKRRKVKTSIEDLGDNGDKNK